jgi:hypothetical protein
MTPPYTPRQGQFLAFIHHYTTLHGRPPAEAEMALPAIYFAAIAKRLLLRPLLRKT